MLVTLTIFQDFDPPFSRRFCCLLPLFEDFGYISLIICAKGLPMSSSFFKQRFSLALNSSWTFVVSRRLTSAMIGLTTRHSEGLVLQCLFKESRRAKKSPQWPQNEMRTGWASISLQCRLKSPQLLNPAPGQSRHLSTRIALHLLSSRGMQKRAPCASPGSTLLVVFSSCCIMLSIRYCVATSTLPSTQSNCSCAKTPIDGCWTLGPSSDRMKSLCAHRAASLSAPPLTALSLV